MIEQNKPESVEKRLTISIKESLHTDLKTWCAQHRTPMVVAVERAIETLMKGGKK